MTRLARYFAICLTLALVCSCSISTAEPIRVYDLGQLPNDSRLAGPKDLNGYFPFQVPAGKAAWEARADELRRRIKIATGIWPLPERTPLNPVIHGKVQRPGFTVEKVYFESVPNHFVTGLLFRPDDGKANVKRPAVLCPHGHGGRLQDYGEANMAKLIESGGEKFEKSGRFPELARCGQLARMGCVTFIFDMLGYADSVQINSQLAHGFAKQRPEFEGQESWGLFSAQAELRLQSIMGIQTWNSIRCLDFLEQLPDVDGKRIAVTGNSGGGTQTILLGAIDPRPIAVFPNGMVSTSMQGGCTCENCTLLRIGTGNVELAGLFAPKPQAMTAVDDWTKDMMTKGYPELQRLYEMVGAKDNVYCREMLHFPHNFNYVSRAIMYDWFNKHMQLGLDSPVIEDDWEPLTPEEYTVWNAEHPKPEGGEKYERSLTKYMAEQSDQQIAAIAPQDANSLQKFREVVGGAFRSIIGRDVPSFDDIQRTKVDKQTRAGYLYFEDFLRLQSKGEEIPIISLFPTGTKWNGDVVIWVDGVGKRGMFNDSGELRNEVRRLVDGGASVVAPDLFQQGEFLPGDQPLVEQAVVKNPREAAAYTFCYNDTVFVRRVHDILTVVSFIRNDEHAPKHLHLIATNGSGAIAAAARAIAGNQIDKAAIDTQGFRFANMTSYRDPNFLPGAVKYGDLPSLLALSAPNALWIGGESGELPTAVKQAYAAENSEAEPVPRRFKTLRMPQPIGYWRAGNSSIIMPPSTHASIHYLNTEQPMMSKTAFTFALLLVAGHSSFVAADDPSSKPIRALIITGGCCHDYDFQTKAIKQAAADRNVNVDWTVVKDGGNGTDAQIALYDNPNWAKGFHVVIHNECFADTTDPDYIRKITSVHKAGVNAVVIHCAMHTYRAATIDDWRELLGVTSRRHEHQSRYAVNAVAVDHPIMQGFPSNYKTAMDELYVIERVWPNTEVLARSTSEKTGETHPVIWTSKYGEARVFGTTYGHSNETFSDEVYLTTLTRGIQWAAGRLGK